MTSPVVSAADIATLRSEPQSSRLGILVFRAPVIVRARISGSHDRGATTINVIIDEQLETPDYHYTVIVGLSDNDDSGGKLRFKQMTGSTIKVSNNSIIWDDYTHIGVLRVIDPKSVLPDTNNVFMDGDISYSIQNEQTHPLAHIGPPAWGYVDEVLKFFSDSQATKSGASISLHSWVFPDGSIPSSSLPGSEGSPLEVTWDFATGHVPHYIKYTCTDSNGRTHTRYNPVWILDDFTDAYCNFELENCSGDFGSFTWSATIKVYGAATTAEFPRDAMIMIVVEDYYNFQKGSVGNRWKYRENVLFVGWITKATTVISDEDSVRFEAYGPMGMLDLMTSWPANLKDGNPSVADQLSSPWDNIPGMTCDLAAFHILTERSTIDHIVDVWLTGNTRRLRYVDIPEGKLTTQLNEYCLSPIGAMAISDAHGSIICCQNPNLLPVGSRSSIPTVVTLQLGDILEDPGAELEAEEMTKNTAQVDFIAFYYNGGDIESYYSLAPPTQYESGDITKIDGIRADSQAEANILSGLYLAEKNNQWRQIKLPTYNYRIYDIAPQVYTVFPLEVAQNLRGIDWSFGQKVICRSVSYEYDPEKMELFVTPVFEADSFGPPGVGGGYPATVSRPVREVLPEQEALALWGSFWFKKTSTDWESRGDLQHVLHGCVDVWWKSVSKANSTDIDLSWHYACGEAGFLGFSRDGGRTWQQIILPDPDNDWGDVTPPTISDLDLFCIVSDRYRNGRFYLLGKQVVGSVTRGWLGITEDNFTSITWTPPVDYSPGGNLRPIWVDANQSYILVTVCDGASCFLYVFDAADYSGLAEYEFGDMSLVELDSLDLFLFPVTIADDIEEWYLAGRLDFQYDGPASGVAHVVKRTAGDTWSVIENGWGEHVCRGLVVTPDGDNRIFWGLEMP